MKVYKSPNEKNFDSHFPAKRLMDKSTSNAASDSVRLDRFMFRKPSVDWNSNSLNFSNSFLQPRKPEFHFPINEKRFTFFLRKDSQFSKIPQQVCLIIVEMGFGTKRSLRAFMHEDIPLICSILMSTCIRECFSTTT